MTSIKVIADDYGTQNLRADNLQPRSARPVASVAGTRGVQPGHGTQYAPPRGLHTAPPRVRRRLLSERRGKGNRRRNDERRHRDSPVMLDTRNYQERRRHPSRRRSDRLSKPVYHGIDTEV